MALSGSIWRLPIAFVRYRYENGSTKPTGEPQVLATFPDYGLSYKYGGWHLTRTIAVGPNNKIYVSVGSSCNACEEKEDVRASVLEMDPDGKNKRHFAAADFETQSVFAGLMANSLLPTWELIILA